MLCRVFSIINKYFITIWVYFLIHPLLQHKQVYSLQAERKCWRSNSQYGKWVGSPYDFHTKSWWPCISKGNRCAPYVPFKIIWSFKVHTVHCLHLIIRVGGRMMRTCLKLLAVKPWRKQEWEAYLMYVPCLAWCCSSASHFLNAIGQCNLY